MSKAVLVLPEMPENCGKCILEDPEDHFCIEDGRGCLNYHTKRPDWCPLRPMPEHEESIAEDYLSANWTDGYKLGWNDALRAIEGSGENG